MSTALRALALTALSSTLAAVGCSSTTTTGTVTPARDAAVVDTGSPKKDAALGDSSVPSPDCAPKDVSGFKAPAYVPAGRMPMACTDAQITAALTACYDSASTQATCDAFVKANAACFGCIETGATDAKWGPLIDFSTATDPIGLYYNVAGCLEIVQGNTTCAKASQAALSCEFAACNPPVCDLSSGDNAALDAFGACLDKAAVAPACKAFEDVKLACFNDDGGAASTVCGADFNNDLPAFGKFIGVFCK